MNYKIIIFLLSFIWLTITGIFPAYCQESEMENNWNPEQIIRAKVLKVENKTEAEMPLGPSGKDKNQLVTVKILNGQYNGQVHQIPYVITDQPGYNIEVNPGDEVILYAESQGNSLKNVYITDYARDKKLLYLTVLFVLLLILLGGKKGIKSIISLTINVIAIFLILLPLIFQGYNPIMVTVIVSAAVTTLTLVMIGGISVKTLSAIIGTTGGVLVAGILALIVGTVAKLTGFSDEEMHTLLYLPQQIDFDCRSILFAGMIIGALGAVMDVGMSIASAVEEVKKANPYLKTSALIKAGMNVGRDIMSTMADTLILAYTGVAIPLMLVFMAYNTPFLKVINLDLIATEVVRALTGSIGIIMSVPITSIAAGILFGKTRAQPQKANVLQNKKGPFNIY